MDRPRAKGDLSSPSAWHCDSSLNVRHLKDYPYGWVLWDLGFVFIPHDIPRWGADLALGIVVLFGLARLLLVTLPDNQSRLEIFIRFCYIWGTLIFLRCFTVGLTRFPRIDPQGPLPEYKGLGWHILDAQSLAEADFMFSGHAVIMTLMGLFVSYYTFRHAYATLFWALVVCGYWAILSARLHYTADVVVAILMSMLVFWLYHMIADPDCLSGWRAVLIVSMEPPTGGMSAPLTLKDGTGKTWELIAPGPGVIQVGRYSSPERRALWSDFVALLGGHQEHKQEAWV